MDAAQFQFTNSGVPLAYEDYLVPRLFQPWAHELLEAARVGPDHAVLDVATGPGTVARAAASRVGARGRVVGTDISAPMLAVARSKPVVQDAASIEYRESPAAPLAVPSGGFDVVLCQQGLQFFPDRAAALGEMLRALRAGGRLAVAVWGALDECEIYAAYHSTLRNVGLNELAEMIALPFSWPRADEVAAAVAAAGFGEVTYEVRTRPLVFEGGVTQAIAALAGSPLGPALAALSEAQSRQLSDVAHDAFRELMDGGAVCGAMRSTVLTARRVSHTNGTAPL